MIEQTTRADGGMPSPPGAVLADRSFNCISGPTCAPGWLYSEQFPGAATVVPDPTAPRSPPMVARVNFPAGFLGGAAPASFETPLTPVRTLYTAMWIQFSSAWQGHPTNVNKVAHFWIGGGNRAVLVAKGADTSPLTPALLLQGLALPFNPGTGTPGLTVELGANLAPLATIQRGLWHKIELTLVGNSAGSADGSVAVALDGVTVLNYAGIAFTGATAGTWDRLQMKPDWGGVSGTVMNAMYLAIDHVYASGS